MKHLAKAMYDKPQQNFTNNKLINTTEKQVQAQISLKHIMN